MDNYEENTKSKKENENWISWADVIGVREKVKTNIETPFEYQKYIIMCIYTMLPPLRNTYTDVKIVKHSRYIKNGNYLLCTKKSKRFIFHEYKTENCHGDNHSRVPVHFLHGIVFNTGNISIQRDATIFSKTQQLSVSE